MSPERRRPYKFCPKCGQDMRQEAVGDQKPLCCQEQGCRFIFWHNASPTVSVIVRDRAGRVLLTERNIDPEKGKLDFPGGFLNADESLETGARRELAEEVGVEVDQLIYLGSVPDTYDYQGSLEPTLATGFWGRIKAGQSAKIMDPREIRHIEWLRPQEIDMKKLAFVNNEKLLKLYLEKV